MGMSFIALTSANTDWLHQYTFKSQANIVGGWCWLWLMQWILMLCRSYPPALHVKMLSTIQSSFVIMLSNITRYCIYHRSDWGRIQIGVWTHKIHSILCPEGRALRCLLWGIWRQKTRVLLHCTVHRYNITSSCIQHLQIMTLVRLYTHKRSFMSDNVAFEIFWDVILRVVLVKSQHWIS